MSIKIAAVDMDGTFLRDDKTYDEELFRRFFKKFDQAKGHFVVASGNQYYQLKSFFEEYGSKITYISENGALIICEGHEIYSGAMEEGKIRAILQELAKYPQIKTVLCGKRSAYIQKSDGYAFYSCIHQYYHRLKRVDDLKEALQDEILKFALTCPPHETEWLMSRLCLPEDIVSTTGGQGCIDLIVKGQNKGNALRKVCKYFQTSLSECIAFGDGGNDVEMLSAAGCGYAVANAGEDAKRSADEIIDSNENQGVLKQLMKLAEGLSQ